ncbi:MAG TPA: hypothetical protein VJO34_16535 [Methylomirabilota bacterium]|nr:hypothetical protein [Methylomirabilota bacterium]
MNAAGALSRYDMDVVAPPLKEALPSAHAVFKMSEIMTRCRFCRGPVKRAFEAARAGEMFMFCSKQCVSFWDEIGLDLERCKVLKRVHKYRALELVRHAYQRLGGRRWDVFSKILRPFL